MLMDGGGLPCVCGGGGDGGGRTLVLPSSLALIRDHQQLKFSYRSSCGCSAAMQH